VSVKSEASSAWSNRIVAFYVLSILDARPTTGPLGVIRLVGDLATPRKSGVARRSHAGIGA